MTTTQNTYSPLTDIHENDKAITLNLEIPGVSKDTVNIAVEKDILTISAAPAPVDSARQALQQEHRSHGYERSFKISSGIDKEKISAHSENGVLTLVLPKVAEHQPRKITIQ